MKRAWYARAQMTRTLMRYLGSHCNSSVSREHDRIIVLQRKIHAEESTYPGVPVKDVDIVARVQEINSTLAIDLKGVWNDRSSELMWGKRAPEHSRSSILMFTLPHHMLSLLVSS